MPFYWLFESGCFMPRAMCGHGWDTWLIITSQLANLSIALAYFAIPISLYYLYRKKASELKYPHLLLLFVIFIALCGLTHICDVVVFWWAPYRLFTLIDVLTAIASIATAIVLPQKVRYLINAPTQKALEDKTAQLQKESELRHRAVVALRQAVDNLEERIAHFELEMEHKMWVHKSTVNLEAMKSQLDLMKNEAQEIEREAKDLEEAG